MDKQVIVNGHKYWVEFPCVIEDGKTWVIVKGNYYWKEHYLKVYYRHERTWDDHLGNTPCGYYVNVPMFNHRKRVYMF